MRLNLTWQEDIKAKEELHQMMRIKHGSQPKGKHLSLSESDDDGWSQDKTTELLNQSVTLK